MEKQVIYITLTQQTLLPCDFSKPGSDSWEENIGKKEEKCVYA